MPVKDMEYLLMRIANACDKALYYARDEAHPRNGELQTTCYRGGADFARLLMQLDDESFNRMAANFPKNDSTAQQHYLKGAADFVQLLQSADEQLLAAIRKNFPRNDVEAQQAYLSTVPMILGNIEELGITAGPDQRIGDL